MHLLDINILLAIIDPAHAHHEVARRWFQRNHLVGWATCPLTENGFIRILSHPRYGNEAYTTAESRDLLKALCAQPGHQFWPDNLSCRSEQSFPNLPGSKHLTDCYLLALALKHQAKLATFDRRIDPKMMPRGTLALHVIA